MKSINEICEKYFEQNSEYVNSVLKACEAYHNNTSHRWPRFPSIGWEKDFRIINGNYVDEFQHLRDDQCMSCGRTRWEVRYDNLPAKCSNQSVTDITGIITQEEKSFFELIERSKFLIEKTIKKRGLSGETLAFLHHTHGIDIEVVEASVELNEQLRKDYMIEWEHHCNTGGAFK